MGGAFTVTVVATPPVVSLSHGDSPILRTQYVVVEPGVVAVSYTHLTLPTKA